MTEAGSQYTGAELVYESLVDAGVDLLVGIPGHQSLPLDILLERREDIEQIRARHETAIPHIAWGYYEAGGGVAATLSVPGPGDTNAMNGLGNALVDRVPMVHLTADSEPEHRGRGSIHELDPETLSPVVKRNEVVTNPNALPEALSLGLDDAMTPPFGPVHFSIPASYLAGETPAPVAVQSSREVAYPDEAIDRAAALLSSAERPVVIVDNGVRRTPSGTRATRELVDELDVPVISTYKGLGIVPGDDPRHLGTTGLAFQPAAESVLGRADVVLALGALFDGPSTGFWNLPMGDRLIHVTDEPERVGLSYDADVAVLGEVGRGIGALADRIDGPIGWDGTRIGRAAEAERQSHFESLGLYEDRSPAPSAGVFRSLREELPAETIATIDIGNFRPWALLEFDFYQPETIVTPGYWTGMGVGLPGAIGAKLANPDVPVVAFVGDGCMMMSLQELHTAAEYDIDLITIVLNNADYNIISREDTLREAMGDRYFGWDAPDFAMLAESFGCVGLSASSPSATAAAVAEALETDAPTVVDVEIDPNELTPGDAMEYDTSVMAQVQPT